MITDEQFNSLLERLSALEQKVENLESTVEDLESQIDCLEEDLSDFDDSCDSGFTASGMAENELRRSEPQINGASIASNSNSDLLCEQIELPDNLKDIGDNVFSECSHLLSLTVPASVKSIGKEFCNHCAILRTVRFMGSCPNGLEDAFVRCWHLSEIIVPKSDVASYQSALPAKASLIIGE